MTMPLPQAAKALFKSLHAPFGSVNVVPLDDSSGRHLVVWVDRQMASSIKTIPSEFEGYPVTVETKPMAFGL
jgi:hypothetical protein